MWCLLLFLWDTIVFYSFTSFIILSCFNVDRFQANHKNAKGIIINITIIIQSLSSSINMQAIVLAASGAIESNCADGGSHLIFHP